MHHALMNQRGMHGLLEQYAGRELGLTLKPPVFGSSPAGLPFLGFRIASGGIFLPRKAGDRIKQGDRI